MYIVAVKIDGKVEFFGFKKEKDAREFMADCNDAGTEAIMTTDAVNG